jgi:Glyoxalase-like domain
MPRHAVNRQESRPQRAPRRSTKPAVPTAATIAAGVGENAPAGVCFTSATAPKTVKSRVHFDLTSSATDRDQEIDRLLAPGARRADIAQTGTKSWIVLADPEGNEFRTVRPKETLIG